MCWEAATVKKTPTTRVLVVKRIKGQMTIVILYIHSILHIHTIEENEFTLDYNHQNPWLSQNAPLLISHFNIFLSNGPDWEADIGQQTC